MSPLPAAALILMLLAGPVPAQSLGERDARPCPGTDLILAEPRLLAPEERHALCHGVQAATEFLRSVGVIQRQGLRLVMVDRPLETRGHPIYGSYDRHQNLIRVMSLQAIGRLPDPRIYDEPVDAAHYLGIIAHEVAHALAQQNTELDEISNSAQEYVAHATQLAVLPTAYRERIISAAAVGAWQPGDEISEIYMAFAPTRFAVKCYLHLTASADPAAFVRYLLGYKWRFITIS